MKIINKHAYFYTFILIEFFIGMSFVIPNSISPAFTFYLVQFMPLSFWATVFILGSIIGIFVVRRLHYVFFVSTPLILYGSILLNGYLAGGIPSLTGFSTYITLGAGSAFLYSYYGRTKKLVL